MIGSDDERAMVKAIVSVFSESTHVLCTRHLWQNTKHKLIDDAKTGIILDKIYGEGGILDAEDTICFDKKFDQLERDCEGIFEQFDRYFQSRLIAQLKSKVN